MKKEILRKNFLSKRSDFFSTDQHKIYSQNLCNIIEEYISAIGRTKDNIGLYCPVGGEVNIMSLSLKFKNISFPRIVFIRSRSEIEFAKVVTEYDLTQTTKFNFKQPNQNCETTIPDIILIPGIVFDKNHNRIGYGRGHFDKFISNCEKINYNPLKIGVCFDFQVADEINADPHDKKMDLIITETRIF